jgi:hypothetical protein
MRQWLGQLAETDKEMGMPALGYLWVPNIPSGNKKKSIQSKCAP